MTKFEKWFEKQFNKIPSKCRSESEIRAELAEAKIKVSLLESEQEERELINNQWRAVLYAKNAVADLVDAPMLTSGLDGHYWLEIGKDGLPTGHVCSGYYGENDRPKDRKGKKWILVKKV